MPKKNILFLMTDEHRFYQSIGKWFTAHSSVKHSQKEYVRGNVHNNTAESFSAILERARQGVFHYLSRKHLKRYLHEIGFRWDHRIPKKKTTRNGYGGIGMATTNDGERFLTITEVSRITTLLPLIGLREASPGHLVPAAGEARRVPHRVGRERDSTLDG